MRGTDRRLLTVVVLTALVLSSAAPVALAQTASDNSTGAGAPTPEANATASSSPTNASAVNATATPVDQDEGSLLGWITGDPKEKARNKGNSTLQQVTLAVLLALDFTPHPNNMDNFFHNPTNGMWDEEYQTYQNRALPLTGLLAAVSLAAYLIGGAAGILPGRYRQGWVRRWASRLVLALSSWTILGAVLTFRAGLSRYLLRDVTASGLEAQLTSAVVIVAFVVMLIFATSTMVMLTFIVGASVVITLFGTPWVAPLIMLTAFPAPLVSNNSNRIIKFYFIMVFLTIPITLFIGAGFTIDVSAQIQDTMSARNGERFATEASMAIVAAAVKFGAVAGGVWLVHYVRKGAESVTGLAMPAPSAEEISQKVQEKREVVGHRAGQAQAAAQGARNTVGDVRAGFNGEPANAERLDAYSDGVQGKGERSRSYDVGRTARDYAQAAPTGERLRGAGRQAAKAASDRAQSVKEGVSSGVPLVGSGGSDGGEVGGTDAPSGDEQTPQAANAPATEDDGVQSQMDDFREEQRKQAEIRNQQRAENMSARDYNNR